MHFDAQSSKYLGLHVGVLHSKRENFKTYFLVTSKIRERVARAQLFLLGSFKFILCADCLGEIFSSPKTSKSILSAHYLKFAIAHLKKAFHFCTSQQLAGLLCGRNSNYNTPEWPKLCKVRMWKKEAINVIISSLVDTDMHSCSPKGMLTIRLNLLLHVLGKLKNSLDNLHIK